MLDPDFQQQLATEGAVRRVEGRAALAEILTVVVEKTSEINVLKVLANAIAERYGLPLPYPGARGSSASGQLPVGLPELDVSAVRDMGVHKWFVDQGREEEFYVSEFDVVCQRCKVAWTVVSKVRRSECAGKVSAVLWRSDEDAKAVAAARSEHVCTL